jgi:hypothetical protein
MIGLSELLIVLVVAVASLLPVVLAVWAVITLQRVRDGQRNIESKLDALTRQLSR